MFKSSSLISVLLALALSVPAAAESNSAAAPALQPPKSGKIRVAFVISENANVIDLAGPWEVFQDVAFHREGQHIMPFELYTVSDTKDPIRATGGLRITPDYTFDNAPKPHVVVVGAQRGRSQRMMRWLQEAAQSADVLMSVCTGAFVLGEAGVLNGKSATTHHQFFDSFEKKYPKVKLVRGTRFVEGEKVSTAGGLTSGIDLALRVVERYFGREAAETTAQYMEHESRRWVREVSAR